MGKFLQMKTHHILALAASVASLLFLAPLPSQSCCAIGRGEPSRLKPIRLDEQRAFLWQSEGNEHMLLSVKYSGGTDEFAWVIPVQSRPKITVEKGAPFTELRRLTEIRMPMRVRSAPPGAMAGGARESKGVTVLERKEEGPYDLAVLGSTSSGELFKWLKENDFRISKDAKASLDYYVQHKFVFVAARIRSGSKQNATVSQRLRDGNIAPMHLVFKSPQITYPLKVTSLNRGDSDMEIYIAGATKPTRKILSHIIPSPSGRGDGLTVQKFDIKPTGSTAFEISGPPGTANSGASFPTLRRLLPKATTITKFTGTLNDAQRQDDLVFADIKS